MLKTNVPGGADGGHYYSFITCPTKSGETKWYKFDDRDVVEFDLHEDSVSPH